MSTVWSPAAARRRSATCPTLPLSTGRALTVAAKTPTLTAMTTATVTIPASFGVRSRTPRRMGSPT